MAKKAKVVKEKSIEDRIWDSANKLRGNLTASEYQNVVLGLVFLKYISDCFEKRSPIGSHQRWLHGHCYDRVAKYDVSLFSCCPQNLIESWMDVHHVAQLGNGGVATHQCTDLLHDVGTVGTKGMTAQNETWSLMR